ncbi:unnamed protein product, partial [Urochloa humidicola]
PGEVGLGGVFGVSCGWVRLEPERRKNIGRGNGQGSAQPGAWRRTLAPVRERS